MSSDAASQKKVGGHGIERDFASLINGDDSHLPHTGKTDVRDSEGRSYSVKSGAWWQIFLYRRNRLETNTTFREMRNVSELMIACLDAFPEDRADYLADKISAKLRLQQPMRDLLSEMLKPGVLPAFLEKAVFNAGEVDYLSILPEDLTRAPFNQKIFHVFARVDVVAALCKALDLANSAARSAGQTDAQKVLFRINGINCGEFEIRTDSDVHYREAKFRLNSAKILKVLIDNITPSHRTANQIITYGKAVHALRR